MGESQIEGHRGAVVAQQFRNSDPQGVVLFAEYKGGAACQGIDDPRLVGDAVEVARPREFGREAGGEGDDIVQRFRGEEIRGEDERSGRRPRAFRPREAGLAAQARPRDNRIEVADRGE